MEFDSADGFISAGEDGKADDGAGVVIGVVRDEVETDSDVRLDTVNGAVEAGAVLGFLGLFRPRY